MEIQRTEIDAHLHTAIELAHPEAQAAVEKAREAINTAFQKTAQVGALIEKAKQIHKQDLFGFMSEHMNSTATQNYLSFNDAYQKRGKCLDKMLLTKSGIWIQQNMDYMRDVTPKPKPGVARAVSSFIGKLNKALEQRPTKEWVQSEREQIKDIMKPAVDFYNSL